MTLSIQFDSRRFLPATADEADQVIEEAILYMQVEAARPSGVGGQAWLSVQPEPEAVPCSYLCVSIDASASYGALMWTVDGRRERSGGIYDNSWISDNPQPLEKDPFIVSDSGYPLFHDPASAVPMAQVRFALKEYCRSKTGERPESIQWVVGEMNGQRHDRAPIVKDVSHLEPDWDGLL